MPAWMELIHYFLNKMVGELLLLLKPFLFLSKIFHRKPDNSFTNINAKISNFYGLKELLNQTLVFHVEGALLKSSSLFPYFMLVAFEAGSPLRALILFLLYPLIYLVGEEELGLKIMVFLSFSGIKEKSFKIGKTVLPKFFLEDVGYEGFVMVMRGGRKVGVTDLPRVMVDGFLTDFLGVNKIVGRELKVAGGYFLGLMEEKKAGDLILNEIFGNYNDQKSGSDYVIGLACSNNSLDKQLFSNCKEVYLITEAKKKNWQTLPREKYPKPLIFFDGRLAFWPTPFQTLAAFIWFPFGVFLCIFRFITAKILPLKLSLPILSFTGMRSEVVVHPNSITTIPTKVEDKRGKLYVCNHRTVFDPFYISLALMKPVSTITYSKSGLTELLTPVKTIRLTRDKERDSRILEKLSRAEDIVVFPEGTTCSEPYVLSFSPLFAELSNDIVPIAIKTVVSMFHGTACSGSKFLDLVFFLMNPSLSFSIEILEKLPRSFRGQGGEKSKFEIANLVQKKIAMALDFESTGLSRKDKYMMLTGI